MPASSTCCMMPPIQTSSPSQIASTSTSIAFSRKRSRKISPCGFVRAQVVGEHLLVVGELHRAPAEHVATAARAPGSRSAGRPRAPPPGVCASAYGGALQPEPLEQRAEAAAVLGEVDRLGLGAEQRHAGRFQARREPQRRLAAEGHDHALGLLDLDDRQHVLERQRLEVQPVGRVVVGRDRLRVAVDHHRVAAGLAHGHRGVHAAVVELDPLADPVRAGAEDHHARPVSPCGPRWRARPLPGRVVVRRLGLELGRAGVDRLVGADAVERAVEVAQLAQEPRVDAGAGADLAVGDAALLQLEQDVVAVGARASRAASAAPRRNPLAKVERQARANAGLFRTPDRMCARSPSPRRPTSCASRGRRRRPGTSRTRTAAT